MAYDPAIGLVVLFGGGSATGLRADTWTWDGTDWTKLRPAHAPSPRTESTMADDSTHGQMVLFGGNDGTLGDTWTWSGSDWTQQSPGNNPPARSDEAMADEPLEGGVLMFGGDNGGDDEGRGDTWVWDGANWEPRNPEPRPAARAEAPAAYDAALGSVVLFGGLGGDSYLGDTWTWDGTDWAPQLAGSIRPAFRSGEPGTRLSIDGWGWAVGERVRVVFEDSVLGDVHLASATTGYGGTLYVVVTIPDDATPGVQYVKAKGMTSGQVAEQTFTVT